MHILVTGGAGYIGSHTVLELLNQDYKVTVVDNLCNSSEESLKRVCRITGKKVNFNMTDLRDKDRLEELFKNNGFDGVIHFAGLKAVDKSVADPLGYYDNNIVGSINLFEVMQKYNVKTIIFSSTAAAYGDPDSIPIKEDAALKPTNPYGQTKIMIEQILKDISSTNAGWVATSLRYFNPIGAHESGEIGEDPNGPPDNLVPYISQVAVGRRDKLSVYGNDYQTPDGTGVRDYIHVVDLAKAHIAALKYSGKPNEYRVFNIGTGKGTSVMQIIDAFKKASQVDVPFVVEARRPGDIATCYSDPSLANTQLRWKAALTIDDACRDAWNWQSKNPKGYNS